MNKSVNKNPDKNIGKITKKIIYVLLLILALYIGFLYGKMNSESSVSAAGMSFETSNTYQEVRDLMDKKFVSWRASSTPPTEKEIEYGLIAGYLSAYKDPYTQFFPPVDAKNFSDLIKGSFGGIGAEVGQKDGRVVIIAPLKDSPAYKAGVKAGDIVVAVDTVDVAGKSTDEVVNIIRGEIGTHVIIGILRGDENKIREFDIVRDEIKIPTVDTEIKGDVFVIHLYNFYAESGELFRQSLVKFIDSGKTSLIIDLRGNPGGYLESAVNIASFFLPEGDVIVTEKGNKESGDNVHTSKGLAKFNKNVKIAVIVDGGSASASEILAGALKDHGIAKVYGQKSYGKGSVQEVINLKDGSSVKITVAKWYTPNGISISEAGIVPDVVVERNEKSTYANELDKILLLVKNQK